MADLIQHTEFDVRRDRLTGRRIFLDDLILEYLTDCGQSIPILIQKGFDTDYSSWKGRWPGPDYSRIDIAGTVHDAIWRTGHLGHGLEAPRVGFVEGNVWWHRIATVGTKLTRCNPAWAAIGYTGLMLGGWVSWIRYTRERERYAESLRARKEEARAKSPDRDQGTQ